MYFSVFVSEAKGSFLREKFLEDGSFSCPTGVFE